MESLIIPDLSTLRYWLEKLDVEYYECGACQSLHLQYMKHIECVIETKIDLISNTLVFTASTVVRPSCIMTLMVDLNQINALTLTAKVFLDVEDDSLPRLVVSQAFNASSGLTLSQFKALISDFDEVAVQIIYNAKANDLLLPEESHYGVEEEEEELFEQVTEHHLIH